MTPELKEEAKIQESPQNTQAQQENQTISASVPPTENRDEINWKLFREQRERERQELEQERKEKAQKAEEARAFKEALEAIVNKPIATPAAHLEESEQDILKKQIREALQEQRKKDEEERLAKEQAELPNRLKSYIPDFNEVCTSENLDYLDYHYPEVTAGYRNQPDSVEKWQNVYKAIKKFVPNSSRKDAARAEHNLQKPQAMSAPGATSTGDTAPRILDDKRKASNWERMRRISKGL